jgi:hypothetical protein
MQTVSDKKRPRVKVPGEDEKPASLPPPQPEPFSERQFCGFKLTPEGWVQHDTASD